MGTGTGIGRVRGLGSAKHGSHHWWQQRLTAGSNLLLLVWLIVSLLRLPLYDYRALVLWLSSPWASASLRPPMKAAAPSAMPTWASMMVRPKALERAR